MNRLRELKRKIVRLCNRDPGIRYAKNYNPDKGASQGGEDGVLHEVFRRLDIPVGWFVEFGAWDGVNCSNTLALVQRGWKGVYIEGDPERYKELEQNMALYRDRIITLCHFVRADGEDSLDGILASTPIPMDFDLLSIDIDSNDYWVWQSVKQYRPKVVIIEYNCNFHAHECKSIPYTDQPEWDGSLFYGASAAALVKLGRSKGYTLIAHTPGLNLIFILNELASPRFKELPVEKVYVGPAHGQRRWEEFVDV